MRFLSFLAWVAFAITFISFSRRIAIEIAYYRAMKKVTQSMKTILLIHYGVKRAEKDGLFKFRKFAMTYGGATSIVTCDDDNRVKVDEIDINMFPTVESIVQKYEDLKNQFILKNPLFNRRINKDFKRIDYILHELQYV